MPRATLTPKQQAFVAEYLVSLNASEAALRAGYSPKTAPFIGAENLKKPQIAAKIAESMTARAERVEVTADDVLAELLTLMRSDVRHFTVDDRGNLQLAPGAPDKAWRAVSSVKHKIRTDGDGQTTREIEFRLWDKNSAIEKVAKHIRFFPPEQKELTGKDGGPMLVAGVDVDDLSEAELLKMAAELAK